MRRPQLVPQASHLFFICSNFTLGIQAGLSLLGIQAGLPLVHSKVELVRTVASVVAGERITIAFENCIVFEGKWGKTTLKDFQF